MDTPDSGTKRKVRYKSTEVEKAESTAPSMVIELPEEVRNKITQEIQNLIQKANELALELATFECDKLTQCLICQKAREVVSVIKNLNKIIREMRR